MRRKWQVLAVAVMTRIAKAPSGTNDDIPEKMWLDQRVADRVQIIKAEIVSGPRGFTRDEPLNVLELPRGMEQTTVAKDPVK